MLNPTRCYHTYIPGFGWDRAPCSLVRTEMKTGGQPGRQDEAGWKQEPEQKSRHGAGGGVEVWHPDREPWAGERAPRLRTEMGNMTYLEGSRAEHRLWLPFGGVQPAGHSTASCKDSSLVGSGLHDSRKQHRASRVGGNHNAWGLQGWKQLQHMGTA